MKAFLLIVAAVLLPFAAIGSFTASSLLTMRDGAAAGSLPILLDAVGAIAIVLLAVCVVRLHRLYLAQRATAPGNGT